MRAELSLGRVGGFPVAVSWSTAVVLLLLTWALADGVLPTAVPGRAVGTYYAAGMSGAVLLIASLLAHELAHAWVARRSGVEVEKLTLWVFGGVATLRGNPPTPMADFRIAAVGPATSMGLAVVFGAVWSALAWFDADELLLALAGWLALANAMLALFNLLPGAPFDGGRVLRALLWWRHGDRDRAAISATTVGQAVAWSLLAIGAVAVLAGDVVGGLWLTLVGWFVMFAARGEHVAAVAEQSLRDVLVRDVMTADVRTGAADLTVEEFIARHVVGGHHSAYPVVGPDGDVVGLMTLGRLRAVPPADRARVLAGAVCLRLAEVARCSPDEPLVTVLGRVTRESGLRALVFAPERPDRPERLIGIVTPADVTRAVESRALIAGVSSRHRS